jgi:serine/threonine protein kinase
MVLNEAKILSSIQHRNIIQFHSCLYDNTEENVYIFMEYAKEGDLLNLIFRTRL